MGGGGGFFLKKNGRARGTIQKCNNTIMGRKSKRQTGQLSDVVGWREQGKTSGKVGAKGEPLVISDRGNETGK